MKNKSKLSRGKRLVVTIGIIAICLIAGIAIISTLTNNSDSKAASSNVSASSNKYTAGDSVTVDSSTGQYSVSIDKATESKNRNDTADSQPNRIIIVNYSYKNISCKQDLSVSHLYFHVYGSDGKLLEVYPSTDAHWPTQTISVGKSNSASVAYGLNDDSKQITVELYDVFNPTNRVATYSLNIE